MYRKSQMARIMEIASLIYAQPRQWTRRRLAERFGVTMTTIQRDINLLSEMEIEIVPHGKQGYEVASDFFLPPLNLDFEETLALTIAANHYRASEGKEAIEVIDRAINKITAVLPDQTNNILNQLVPQIEVPHKHINRTDETHRYRKHLYRAIREKRKVTIEYNSFSSRKRVQHRLSPYAVVFCKRAWYVIGHSDTFDNVLTFRINRIESLSMTQLGYTIPEDFSAARHLSKSWDIMSGPDTHVVIVFAPRIAPLIREVNWHSTQKIQELDKRGLLFEVTVAGWREIGWWILGWGHEAIVIDPLELRDWIAQEAQAMVKGYERIGALNPEPLGVP